MQVVVATRMEGGCDDGSPAFGSGFAGQAEVAGAPSRSAAGAPAAVLGVCCGRIVERGRGDGGRSIAAGWVPLVPNGGRDAAVAPVALGQTAFGTVSFVCWAGGDRAVAGAGLGRAGGCTPAGTGGVEPRGSPDVRDLARAASQCGHAGRRACRNAQRLRLDDRAATAQWHAGRSARRPRRLTRRCSQHTKRCDDRLNPSCEPRSE